MTLELTFHFTLFVVCNILYHSTLFVVYKILHHQVLAMLYALSTLYRTSLRLAVRSPALLGWLLKVSLCVPLDNTRRHEIYSVLSRDDMSGIGKWYT